MITVFIMDYAILIMYNYMNDYFSSIIYTESDGIKMIIWLTCCIFSMAMGALLVVTWKHLRRVYEKISGVLGLIPFEKLAEDEQTIFLIKQFIKQ